MLRIDEIINVYGQIVLRRIVKKKKTLLKIELESEKKLRTKTKNENYREKGGRRKN